jgi:hypothetical protein
MTSEDMSIDVYENFSGRHVLSHEPGYKSRSRMKLLCLVTSSKYSSGQDTKGLECLLREPETRQFVFVRYGVPGRYEVFERYGYAKISEYSVQGRFLVNFAQMKNAEWFPRFKPEDAFGRYEIIII